MARSRRSSPKTTTARKPAAAPAPAKSTPSPAPATPSTPATGGGMMGGLIGTIAEGMAFGTGSAIARTAVNSVADSFGSSGSNETPAAVATAPIAATMPSSQANVCINDQKAFLDCLTVNKNDISACQFYLDAFNQCKQQGAYL